MFDRSLIAQRAMMLVQRHHEIKTKTLIVWGEDDPWQPVEDGERLAREIPGVKLVKISNASHWVQQDAPQEWLQAVMPFLKSEQSQESQHGYLLVFKVHRCPCVFDSAQNYFCRTSIIEPVTCACAG